MGAPINAQPPTVNHSPTASPISITTAQDTAFNGTATATDADGDTLTYTLSTNPSNGTATVQTNGVYTYTPTAGYSGADLFRIRADDGKGGTVLIPVSVTITAVTAGTPVANPTTSTQATMGQAVIITPSVTGAFDPTSIELSEN